MAEAAVARGPAPEQPVQRRRLDPAQQLPDLEAHVQPAGLVVDGFLEPGRGLAGRRRERDQRPGRPQGGRLLGQQRDDPGDRRRLAGARAAGHDREPTQHRARGGQALAGVGLAGEQSLQPVGEQSRPARPDRRPRSGRAGRPPVGAPGPSSGRGTTRCRAVAGDAPQLNPPRRRRGRSAPRPRSTQVGSGHGSDDRSTGSSASTAAVSRIVARSTWTCASRGARDRERDRKQHRLVVLTGDRRQPRRNMDVGRAQHPGRVELAQQSTRAPDTPDVERVELGGAGDNAHAATTPRSSASLRASTSAPLGRHANTPYGVRCTVGVAGPAIPRRNRYRTPAMSRSGS